MESIHFCGWLIQVRMNASRYRNKCSLFAQNDVLSQSHWDGLLSLPQLELLYLRAFIDEIYRCRKPICAKDVQLSRQDSRYMINPTDSAFRIIVRKLQSVFYSKLTHALHLANERPRSRSKIQWCHIFSVLNISES